MSSSDVSPAGRSVVAIVRFAAIAAVLLAADLAIKTLAFERVTGSPVVLVDGVGVPPHDAVVVVPKVLALQLTTNTGAVFGLGSGGRWLFVGFSVVAVIVLASVFARSAARAILLHAALAAVLAGALGNLYDRLRFGVVRDMFWLFPEVNLPFGWRWPDGSPGLYPWIFNFADACLVLGLITLMIMMYRHDRAAAKSRSGGEKPAK